MRLQVSAREYGAIRQPFSDALAGDEASWAELAAMMSHTPGRAAARRHPELDLDQAFTELIGDRAEDQ